MKQEERLKTMKRMEEKKDKEMGVKWAYLSVISNCMEQNPSLKEICCSVDQETSCLYETPRAR
jgi:hypothetical protein